MWKIWVAWTEEKKRPKEIYQKKFLEKLKKLEKPSEYLKLIEYEILKALNGSAEITEKTRWEISKKSDRNEIAVARNLKALEDRGLVKARKQYVKQTFAFKWYYSITPEGLKLLREWNKIYF